ncbi:MAG: hypothetical protein IT270_01655 [Saprospiraceae bacterium]|nr:hypothetical protein [Saprospiraceae bacterium]
MSYATEYLRRTLLYDSATQTLHLSSKMKNLGEASKALLAAFGSEDVLVREVQESPAPTPTDDNAGQYGGKELLRMQGKSDVFGLMNANIYLEFGVKGEDLVTMVLVIPLPDGWSLKSRFDKIHADMLSGEGILENAILVISFGLPTIDRSHIIRSRVEGFDGYPLQNGAQIIAKSIPGDVGILDKDFLEMGGKAGLPNNILPPIEKPTDFVEIRLDMESGWFTLEKWWTSEPPEGFEPESIHAVGIATRCNFKEPDHRHALLLREVSIPNQPPIVLEAHILDDGMGGFYPVRYSARFTVRTPLGEAGQALGTLIGIRANIMEALDLKLPDFITLLGFTYAPKEWIFLSFAAGDYKEKDEHLISIGPIELKEVDFKMQLSISQTGGPISVELEGIASFFDVPFQVKVRPWTLIEGGLADPEGINLAQLVQKAFSVDLPFGLDTLTLSSAWVTHFLGGQKNGTNSTDLQLRLDGEVDLVPNAIKLTDIQLEVSIDSDKEKKIRLAADFKMGSLNLFTSVTNDNGSWIFSGNLRADGDGIHLTELINDLMHSFGASVPDEIPDILLESFSLEYNTAARSLDIQCITNWTIENDIPVLGGLENKVILQLLLTREAQSGSNNTALSINWFLEKGEHTLACDAYLSNQSKTFSFDYNVPDPSQPTKLTDLITALELPEIPTPVADVLDSVFEVSSLSMSYSRPGNNVEIAWTRPLGEGVLLMEYNQSSLARTAPSPARGSNSNTSRHIGVSWLGDKEDSTIGIIDVLDLVGAGHLLEDTKGVLRDARLDAVEELITKVEEILTFKQLGFSWDSSDKSNTFSFNALSTYRKGTKSFLMVRTGDKPGFVAGVSFSGSDDHGLGIHVQDMDFLSQDVRNKLEEVMNLLPEIELTHLLVASMQANAYQPPGFSTDSMLPIFARQGSSMSTSTFGNGGMRLNKGLSIGARVKFDKKSPIRRVIDIEELNGQVTIGAGELAVQVALPLGLKLDAGSGTSLALTSPVLQVKGGTSGAEFDIMGGLDLMLFGQRLNLAGWLSLAEESLTGHIQIIEIPDFIPIPAGSMPGVQIIIEKDHPLSLEVGLQFEPAGLDLGVSGSFAVYKNETELVYGEAVVVLEMIEEVPNPLYVEFSMDEMNIPILMEAMTGVQLRLHQLNKVAQVAQEGAEFVSEHGPGVTGGVADAAAGAGKAASVGIEAVESAIGHVQALMSKVEMEDVRLYWADSIVNLPDGSTAKPGIGMRGKLRVCDWDAFAMMDMSMSGMPGISGHFECEPIQIGNILRIWGDGEGIHKKPKTAEDIYKEKKNNVKTLSSVGKLPPKNPAAVKDEGDWYLSPGGPVLHFSTRSTPFLHADLHAELFGVLQSDIHAEITDEGFMFDFKVGAGNVATAELECHWWKNEGQFEAHGNMGIQLMGDIRPIIPGIDATKISLNTSLDASVSLIVNKDKFEFTANGDFLFQGARLKMPELTITVKFSTLEDLAKLVLDWIVEKAKHIFSEIIGPVGAFVEKGVEEVKQVAVAAYHFGETCYKEAKEDVTQIGQAVEAGFEQGAEKFKETTAEIKKQADEVMNGIAAKTADIVGPILEDVKNLGAKALERAKDVGKQLAYIAGMVAKAVADAAFYIIDVGRKALEWVGQRLEDARRWVSEKLRAALEVLDQIDKDVELAIRAIEAEIEAVEQEIEALGRRLLQLLKDLEAAAERALHKAEQWVGGAAHTVAGWFS